MDKDRNVDMINYTVGLEGETALHYQIGESLPDDAVAAIHTAIRDVYDKELEDFHTGIPSNIILGRD
jgi:hypothetical protein